MKSSSYLIPLLIASAFGSGCTTTHRFTVDAIRSVDGTSANASYRLVSALPIGSEYDALFDTVAGNVATALSSKGMFEAPDGVAPELEIEVAFGMDAPVRRARSHTEPVYVVPAFCPGVFVRAGADSGKAAPRQMSPQQIAERTITTIETERPKFLRLTAWYLPETYRGDGRREAWDLVVTNRSESDDLGKYLPLMTAAAMDLIGTNTGGYHAVELRDDDRRVRFLKRGL